MSTVRSLATGLAFALCVPPCLAAQQPARPLPEATFSESPRVSPDGARILFLSNRDGAPALYVMNFDGSNVTALPNTADAGVASWSADGKKIVFATSTPGRGRNFTGHIIVMAADGSGRKEVASGPGYQGPGWSPDGTRLVLAAGTFPAFGIITMRATDGQDVKQVTTNGAFNFEPSWSPDGRHIAYASARRERHADPRIYVANADGTDEHRITDADGSHEHPTWSADGMQIAYQVSNIAKPDAQPYVVSWEGEGERSVIPHTTSLLDEAPSWVPGNARLVIQSNRDGPMALYVIDISSGRMISRLKP